METFCASLEESSSPVRVRTIAEQDLGAQVQVEWSQEMHVTFSDARIFSNQKSYYAFELFLSLKSYFLLEKREIVWQTSEFLGLSRHTISESDGVP